MGKRQFWKYRKFCWISFQWTWRGRVGASDLRQYLRKAKEFARNLKRARKVGRVKGRTPGVIRYEKNGRYIDLAPNGDIISFGEFKPLK